VQMLCMGLLYAFNRAERKSVVEEKLIRRRKLADKYACCSVLACVCG
jgi:hypothetical protein